MTAWNVRGKAMHRAETNKPEPISGCTFVANLEKPREWLT